MLASALGYSLIPLSTALSGGENSPFFFNAAMNAGLCIGLALFLFRDKRARNARFLKTAVRRARSFRFVPVVANGFGYAAFALSARFVNVSVAATLYELSPAFVMLLTARLFRGRKRFRKLTKTTLGLTAVSFAGAGLAVASQNRGGTLAGGLPRIALGAGLGTLSAVLASFSAAGFKWGADLSSELRGGERDAGMETLCATFASFASAFVALPLSAIAGAVLGETPSREVLAVGFAAGVFANAVPTVLYRLSSALTENLGVYAINYLTPVFALGWLFALSLVEADIGLLATGAALIVFSNLLVSIEPAMRRSAASFNAKKKPPAASQSRRRL